MTPHSSSRRGHVPPHVDVGGELLLADAVIPQPFRGESARDRFDVVAPACHARKLAPPARTPQAVRRLPPGRPIRDHSRLCPQRRRRPAADGAPAAVVSAGPMPSSHPGDEASPGGGEGGAPGEGVRAALPPFPEATHDRSRHHLRDYTLRPSELAAVLALLVEARQPCIVWGRPGAAKSQIAQQVAADASRSTSTSGAAARPRRSARHPLARRRRPHPLGAAGVPAPVRRPRPLAHQPRGAALGRADGPGGAVPVGSRPQGRRVRAARGRLAHRPAATARPTAAWCIGCRPAGVPLRPPGHPGRRRGLAGLGRGERDRRRGAVLHHLRIGSPAPVRPAVEGARVPVSEDVGIRKQHRQAPATGSTRRPSGRCSGARSARPRRSSSRRS